MEKQDPFVSLGDKVDFYNLIILTLDKCLSFSPKFNLCEAR